MNKYKKVKFFAIFIASFFLLFGCDEAITDYGFTGQISGRILDQAGNIVSGDITTTDMTVYVLGELDTEPIPIRVKGDGTYTNIHLYPQKYKVWLVGPVANASEYNVDLTGSPVVQDFTVTPYLTIPPPSVVGSPTANEVTVNYSITENAGYTAVVRNIYVSTVSYPGQSTGSGAYWQTIKKAVNANQGTETITGLKANTTYYIRVEARADGTNMFNLSDQISFKTP